MKDLKIVLDMIKMLTGVHFWLCQAGNIVQLEIYLDPHFSFFSLLLLRYVCFFVVDCV